MIHTILDENGAKWFFDEDNQTLRVDGSEDVSEHDITSFYDAMVWLRDNDYISDDMFSYNNTRQFLIQKGIISAETIVRLV
jgi:hypothetical protein